MSKQLTMILLMVVTCMLCQPASSEMFIVEDNLVGSVYLGEVDGFFDLSSVVPTDGQYAWPYDVTSAYYTMTFVDDGDLAFDHSETTDWVWNPGSWMFYSGWYSRTITDYYYDQEDQFQVNVEGEYSTDSTYWFSRSESLGRWPTEHDGYNAEVAYYTEESGYTGSVTMVHSLGTDALASLATDGILDFTLTATYGDILYTGGTLTVDIEANPVPILDPVPLPGAALLGMLGLSVAGMGLRRWAC